nr:NADH-ubiquinone oxidoreductase-F iron-sulfur binding region domain-containing protein [Actinomadura rugatobispora]
MDRRLATTTEQVRFRVDATRCDGQGVCVLVAPELFELDRYGLAYVTPDGDRLAADDEEIRARGLEADAMCPRNAIREELAARAAAPPPEPAPAPEPGGGFAPRLLLADGTKTESLEEWRAAGGWRDHTPGALLDLVEQAGLAGHGGAGFPTAEKWRRVIGADRPVVVANGSEREPGTEKDRHLMAHRPYAVLDGLRLAMRAVGAALGYVAVDEDAHEAAERITAAVEATRGDDLEIRVQRVPTRYVAGEETALLSVIEGKDPLPRIRPPYPSDVGVFGRATLVQNVETLVHLAVAAAIGAEAYRSGGTPGCPGSGVFTIGRFGGPFEVAEIEFGRSLAGVLDDHGLLDGARAVLVGGYAGGLLTPDRLDAALTPDALRAAGASLGTKSIQVLGPDDCPVRVVAGIVRYFGEQTAGQCPPCSRGLPDMAAILDDLDGGRGGAAALAELETFMATLSGRGVCRLPDGAARVALSLLTGFASVVAAHAGGGCPDLR